MRTWLLIAALLLPLAWLGAGTLRQQAALSQAGEWRIPIAGYDPRDPLRGRYIEFAYSWEVSGNTGPCERPEGCDLCLSRDGPVVRAAVVAPGTACPARVDLGLSRIAVRPGFGPGSGDDAGVRFTSRIFVSEASAPELERQLQTEPMAVVAALAPDGRLINRRIEPAG